MVTTSGKVFSPIRIALLYHSPYIDVNLGILPSHFAIARKAGDAIMLGENCSSPGDR